MKHPFAEHIGLLAHAQAAGHSRCELSIAAEHLNPHKVVNGAVLFALADTGMGAALYPMLAKAESCATIEIKINFLRPAVKGTLVCETSVLKRGRTTANLESKVYLADVLIATASGNFAVFPKKERLRLQCRSRRRRKA